MITYLSRYYLDGMMDVDIVGYWVHCHDIEALVAAINVMTTVAGNGQSVLRVEMTNDPAKDDIITVGSFTAPVASVGTVGIVQSTEMIGYDRLCEWVRLVWRHDPSDPVQGTLRVRLVGRD